MKLITNTPFVKAPRMISHRRTIVQTKAYPMDVTNAIVGVIAISLIVDISKTFYAQYLRNQQKELEQDEKDEI